MDCINWDSKEPNNDETCRMQALIEYNFNDKNTIILKIELEEGVLFSNGTKYEIDFRKTSKNPIQKSKFFNLAEMLKCKKLPETSQIAKELDGRTWEEFL